MTNPNIDPQFQTLDEAIAKATSLAEIMGAAQTVVAEIVTHTVSFHVMQTGSYAELREKKLTDHMAPVASVLPNGKVELYMREFGRYANV